MYYDTSIWAKAIENMTKKPVANKDEEWIWVKGYKGMDKAMKCHGGFPYELGTQYDMPENEPVYTCQSGYHLCLKLIDVYDYVEIGKGNRFFEVEALVRKSEVDSYGRDVGMLGRNNKLAAKSIRIIRELSVDEILEPYPDTADWTIETKRVAIEDSLNEARRAHRVQVMVKMGYAEPLASYIVYDKNGEDGYNLAVALDTQLGISMDTKINAIFSHI